MSELRKTYSGGLFYLTFTFVGWADVFTRKIFTDELIKNLKYWQDNKDLEIYAYVVMTNHLHLIATRKDDKLLSDLIRDFKSFTAKRFLQFILENPQEARKKWLEMIFKYLGRGTKQNICLLAKYKSSNRLMDFSSNRPKGSLYSSKSS